MGWLKRLFGLEKPEETDEQAVAEVQEAAAAAQEAAGVEEIPPERVGLYGEYDYFSTPFFPPAGLVE